MTMNKVSLHSAELIKAAAKSLPYVTLYLYKESITGIGVPFAGTYEEVFTTDAEEFGGNGITNGNAIKTLDEPMHGFEQCIPLTLPPLSVIYLKCKRRKQTKAAVHTDKTPTKVTKTVRKTADKKTKTTDKKTKKKAD